MPRQNESASAHALGAVPASRASLVPCFGVSVHAASVWLAPDCPGALRPLLPLFLEAMLVWLPLASLCVWFVRSAPLQGRRSPSQRMSDVIVATAALAALGLYLLEVRLPAQRDAWSAARLVTELHALGSTTFHGLPAVALGMLIGWAALSAVMARTFGELAKRSSRLEAQARPFGAFIASLLFAVGSSAVLRYATGSPWPFFG